MAKRISDLGADLGAVRVFIEPRDVWVGYFRGDTHHFVCPLPCLVLRWPHRRSSSRSAR